MALTVEDGTVVAGADSYVTVAEARAYTSKRGYTTFDGLSDGAVEPYIILAMDFVESFRNRFKGDKVSSAQSLQWPRQYVYIDDIEVATNEIPEDLKKAVSELAVQAVSSTLTPNTGGRVVVLEKVGEVEVEYAARGPSTDYAIFNKAQEWIDPLLEQTGPLYTVRV